MRLNKIGQKVKQINGLERHVAVVKNAERQKQNEARRLRPERKITDSEMTA
jgi:hypothetical protein